MACCFSAAADAPPQTPPPRRYRDRTPQEVEELRQRLSAIMPPLEVDMLQQDATVNATRLPSTEAPQGASPFGASFAFQRRHSMRGQQAAAAAAAGQQSKQQSPQPDEQLHGDSRSASGGLQWTDSRKLLEAAIGMEQLGTIHEDVQATHEIATPSGKGWGWGGGGWGEGALDAAEQRLQSRLWKLKLEHSVMDGDGNCQFRSISFGLYGTPRHYAYVRRKTVEYMRSRRQDFDGFLGEEFDSYVASMAQDGTWGDELTLRAACEALAVLVNVITSDEQNWFLRYIPRTCRPKHEIFMTYVAPIHYNAVRRQNTGDRLRRSFGGQHFQLARAVSTYQRRFGLPEEPHHVVQAAMAGA